MTLCASLLGLILGLVSPAPTAGASPSAAARPADGPIIIFLVDNSASLPPLDPQEKRVAALEKMFTFLERRPYRLVLFAGRGETVVDDPSRYDNRGQWTDFLAAFTRARDVIAEYPKGTEFRLVMLTDGVIDPDPKEWAGEPLPPGTDLRAHVRTRALDLVRELGQPLYVILVGDVPLAGLNPRSREQAPQFVVDLVATANGARASAAAQRLSSFFNDDGVLVRKFIFRVEPGEGLKKVEPVVRRIVAPPRAGVELQLLGSLVLPLVLFLALLLGIVVRSFPGPGDLEIVELAEGLPVHLAVDKPHKTADGWGATGLSLLADARDAAATLQFQRPQIDLSGIGLSLDSVDALSQQLLQLELEPLRRRLEELADNGTKEEKIYALNLDYMAKDFDAAQAEKILTTPLTERRRVPGLDFLRAKAHLLANDALRARLVEPRVQLLTYGNKSERKELEPGTVCRIGRYGFRVKDVARGGRKDVRVVLYYDRIPSLLGLKTWLPDVFQRVFRLRRSLQRVVQ